jgi:plastocyanin
MRPTARTLLIGTISGSLATALAVAPAARAAPRTVTVSMKAFAFVPASVVVHVGDTVRWTYDETPTTLPFGCESLLFRTPVLSCPGHSATSTAAPHGHRLFDSGLHRAAGFPYRFRFTHAGTYTYFCTVHGGPHPNNPVTHMDGTVVVKA